MIAAAATIWCGFVLIIGGAVIFTRMFGDDSFLAYGLTALTAMLYSYAIYRAEQDGRERERRNWVRD